MAPDIVTHSALTECRERVRDTFVADCGSRAKIGRLPVGTYAGGQYFGQPEQRGILGTAAALRVLSSESRNHQPSRDVAQGLLRYLARRKRIELDTARTDAEQRSLWRQKLPRDESNTIRQAELLLSLTYVPNALAASDGMKGQVADRLLRGRSQDGNGWGYTLTDRATSSLLPTCHAIRSLARNGNDVNAELEHVARALHQRIRRHEPDIGTAYIDCFAMLVLEELELLSVNESRTTLDHLWRVLANHLAMPREANIDVLGGPANDFVRVPWQLHLMALSARDRPWRRFLSPRMQRLLGETVEGVLRGPGFRYPESGENVSTRTYAYIYETISTILAARGGATSMDSRVARVLRTAERPSLRVRRMARTLATVGVVATIAFSIVMWQRGNTGSWKDLAPNFVAAMLLAAFGWVARPKS